MHNNLIKQYQGGHTHISCFDRFGHHICVLWPCEEKCMECLATVSRGELFKTNSKIKTDFLQICLIWGLNARANPDFVVDVVDLPPKDFFVYSSQLRALFIII